VVSGWSAPVAQELGPVLTVYATRFEAVPDHCIFPNVFGVNITIEHLTSMSNGKMLLDDVSLCPHHAHATATATTQRLPCVLQVINPFTRFVQQRAMTRAQMDKCRQPIYTLNTHFFTKVYQEGVSGKQADEVQGSSLCISNGSDGLVQN
jgi:hypothetical protein